MGSQAKLRSPRCNFKTARCAHRVREAILGRFWGAQRAPKTKQIWTLSRVKIGTRFRSALGVDFGPFGGPKTCTLKQKKRPKEQDKDRRPVGENSRKTKGKTHISHFRERPGVKKKEVERPKIEVQNGERNSAPKKTPKGVHFGTQKGSKSEKKTKQKNVTKKNA